MWNVNFAKNTAPGAGMQFRFTLAISCNCNTPPRGGMAPRLKLDRMAVLVREAKQPVAFRLVLLQLIRFATFDLQPVGERFQIMAIIQAAGSYDPAR